MIRILIVEDNQLKSQAIEKVIATALLHDQHTVCHVTNVFEAGQKLQHERFELMILDINVPMRPDEESRRDGGINLLQQLKTRRTLRAPDHIVGLTGFADLHDEHGKLFEQLTWTLVQYEPASDEWVQQLTYKLEHIANADSTVATQGFESDLAIVTAMERWELTKVRELEAGWERRKVEGDDTFYYAGQFRRGDKTVKVSCASAIQVGMPAATGLAMKMCMHFKPRYLAMTGIAAGVKGGFGDILIADKAWDYGSGKSRSINEGSDGTVFGASTFEPAPTAIPLDAEIVEKLRSFAEDRQVLRKIESNWTGKRAATALENQIGPVASGAAVLENKPLVNAIKSHDRKLIGVEMETYGIFLAARICPHPRPKALSIKSICDFGDIDKDDDWQEYASYTSAQFLYEFALEHLSS